MRLHPELAEATVSLNYIMLHMASLSIEGFTSALNCACASEAGAKQPSHWLYRVLTEFLSGLF